MYTCSLGVGSSCFFWRICSQHDFCLATTSLIVEDLKCSIVGPSIGLASSVSESWKTKPSSDASHHFPFPRIKKALILLRCSFQLCKCRSIIVFLMVVPEYRGILLFSLETLLSLTLTRLLIVFMSVFACSRSVRIDIMFSGRLHVRSG